MTRQEIAKTLGLSPEQTAAILRQQSSAIIAGAGSGKTTTMAASIAADLISDKIPPEEILATTFTRAAAANLYEKTAKVAKDLGYKGPIEKLTIGTIDSVTLQILKNNSLETRFSPSVEITGEFLEKRFKNLAWNKTKDRLADENENILKNMSRLFKGNLNYGNDQIDYFLNLATKPLNEEEEIIFPSSQEIIFKLTERLSSDQDPEQIQALIDVINQSPILTESDLKNVLTKAPEEVRKDIEFYFSSIASLSLSETVTAARYTLSLYKKLYQEIKDTNEVADYNDIETGARDLFSSDSFTDKFRVIYVDEAQDTSSVQQENMKNLLEPGGKIIIIGDVRQSIYSWRQADPESFLEWVTDLGSVELAANYRSTASVVDFVNQSSREMPNLKQDYSDMVPFSKEEGSVSLKFLLNSRGPNDSRTPGHIASDKIEAPIIAKIIKRHIEEENVRPGDICVIARTNTRIDLITRQLLRLGIGAEAFFSRDPFKLKEASAPLAILNLFAEPDNDQALIQLLSSPMFAISPDRLEYLVASKGEQTLRQAILNSDQFEKVAEFLILFEKLYKNKSNYFLTERIWFLLSRFEYFSVIDGLGKTGAEMKNLDQVFKNLKEIESRSGPIAKIILDEVEIKTKVKDDYQESVKEKNVVKLMTVNTAKGLEFPIVFYTDLGRKMPNGSNSPVRIADGQLGVKSKDFEDPFFKKGKLFDKESGAREEERCIYVGLTRAERELIVIARGRFNKDLIFHSPAAEIFAGSDFSFAVDGGDINEGSGEVEVGGSVFPAEIILAKNFEPDQSEAGFKDIDLLTFSFNSKKESLYRDGLSYTKLSDWQECSMRRFLENDLGLKSTIEINSDSSGARERGIAIHKALEDINWADPTIPNSRFKKEIESFVKSEAGQIIKTDKGLFYPEARFELGIAGQRIRGVLDAVLINDGEVTIIDWKTGRERPYPLQEEIYALAGFRLGGSQVKTIWQFEHRADIKLFDSEKEVEERLEQVIGEIFKKDPLPVANNLTEAAKNPVCNQCPGLIQICPVSFKNKK